MWPWVVGGRGRLRVGCKTGGSCARKQITEWFLTYSFLTPKPQMCGIGRVSNYFCVPEPGQQGVLCVVVSTCRLCLCLLLLRCITPSFSSGYACEQQLLEWFWWNVTFVDCGHRPKNLSYGIQCFTSYKIKAGQHLLLVRTAWAKFPKPTEPAP